MKILLSWRNKILSGVFICNYQNTQRPQTSTNHHKPPASDQKPPANNYKLPANKQQHLRINPKSWRFVSSSCTRQLRGTPRLLKTYAIGEMKLLLTFAVPVRSKQNTHWAKLRPEDVPRTSLKDILWTYPYGPLCNAIRLPLPTSWGRPLLTTLGHWIWRPEDVPM